MGIPPFLAMRATGRWPSMSASTARSNDDNCNESCVASGDASGECRFEMCECRPRLDLPPGPTAGLSSGGAVARSSAGYQMELTIGPVAPAAERASATQDVELGLQPQADPARRQAP